MSHGAAWLRFRQLCGRKILCVQLGFLHGGDDFDIQVKTENGILIF
jgi:hypothetical protein